jgi:hypothetical protein
MQGTADAMDRLAFSHCQRDYQNHAALALELQNRVQIGVLLLLTSAKPLETVDIGLS